MLFTTLIQVITVLDIALSSPTFTLNRLSLQNLLLCGSSNNAYSVQATIVVAITLIYLSACIIIQYLETLHTITNNIFTLPKIHTPICLV